jgi:hypothetical protein
MEESSTEKKIINEMRFLFAETLCIVCELSVRMMGPKNAKCLRFIQDASSAMACVAHNNAPLQAQFLLPIAVLQSANLMVTHFL